MRLEERLNPVSAARLMHRGEQDAADDPALLFTMWPKDGLVNKGAWTLYLHLQHQGERLPNGIRFLYSRQSISISIAAPSLLSLDPPAIIKPSPRNRNRLLAGYLSSPPILTWLTLTTTDEQERHQIKTAVVTFPEPVPVPRLQGSVLSALWNDYAGHLLV